jgi:hypothetical protein
MSRRASVRSTASIALPPLCPNPTRIRPPNCPGLPASALCVRGASVRPAAATPPDAIDAPKSFVLTLICNVCLFSCRVPGIERDFSKARRGLESEAVLPHLRAGCAVGRCAVLQPRRTKERFSGGLSAAGHCARSSRLARHSRSARLAASALCVKGASRCVLLQPCRPIIKSFVLTLICNMCVFCAVFAARQKILWLGGLEARRFIVRGETGPEPRKGFSAVLSPLFLN